MKKNTQIKLLILGKKGWSSEEALLTNPNIDILDNENTVITRDRDYCIINSDPIKQLVGSDFHQRHITLSEQKISLDKFGINTPNYWLINSNGDILRIFNSLEENTKLVIKSVSVARSIGKGIINQKQAEQLFYNLRNIKETEEEGKDTVKKNAIEYFYKTLGITKFGEYRNEKEKHILYHKFIENSYILEEKINIAREFRLIYVKGALPSEYVMFERFGYGLNVDVEEMTEKNISDKKYLMNSETDVGKKFMDMLMKIKKLGDSINVFTLSFDLYMEDNNDMGILEYSSSYTIEDYSFEDKKKLTKQIENCFRNTINKNKVRNIYKEVYEN